MIRALLLIGASVLLGCSTASELRCRTWQMQGELIGTVSSCGKCVDTLGSGNIEAVKGCALGLDAASLLNP